MYFKKKFYKYFFLIISFITTAKPDLPSQLNDLTTGLNQLKGRLGVLKGALEKLKEELGKENKFDEFINTVSSDKYQKISETDLPPELKAIPVSTKEETETFKEKLTETFEKLPEDKLDGLMGSVLYDTVSGDEKKKLVQTAAAQAWVNTLKKDLSSDDENTVNTSLDKFVEGATLYVEKHCTVPIPEFQQPNDFLSKVFDSLSDPETSLKQLEEITKEKEKTYKKKKTDEFAQLSELQKNKLSTIKKLTKQTIITIANAYFTGHLHSLFEGKPNDLGAFEDYLIDQGIKDDKASEIVTLIKNLDQDNLSLLIDTNEKIENLAYLKVLLEFLNKEKLLDKFNEKINPTTSLNPFASFFGGGEEKLTRIQNKKNELLDNQMSEVNKFENKAFRDINNYIDAENRFHTLRAKIDPNNFIAAFEQLEQFETQQQKEKFRKIIKNVVIAHKTASTFHITKEEVENINHALDNMKPLDFLSEDIAKANQENFIKIYILLFRNVFRSHAERNSDALKPILSLKDYLKEVFNCFDKVTKTLLFKNRNRILATIIEHEALMSQIEQSFYEIVESFYQDRFMRHQDISFEDVISLLLYTKQGFLVNNFNHFKEMLFNNILDVSQSLCSNIALKTSSTLRLKEELKLNLLNKIKGIFNEIEKIQTGTDIHQQTNVENARKELPKIQIDLENAQDELTQAEDDDKEYMQDKVDRLQTKINNNNKLLEDIKSKTLNIINKYTANNFDSSKWKPTSQAFNQATDFSFRLNLEDNLEAVNNWDEAIQENRGGNWHKFLIADTRARGALRQTFNQLKYQLLLDTTLLELFNKIKIGTLHEINIDSLIKLFPQYSQYWLDLIEKLFKEITAKESEIKIFKERLEALPEELQNYLLIHTYFRKKITAKIQDFAKSQYLNDVMLMIKNQPSPLTLERLKKDIPQKSSAWHELIKMIIGNQLTPSLSGHFVEFISKQSDLLEYLGGGGNISDNLFIDDVVNKSKITLRKEVEKDRIFIQDPRRKKKA